MVALVENIVGSSLSKSSQSIVHSSGIDGWHFLTRMKVSYPKGSRDEVPEMIGTYKDLPRERTLMLATKSRRALFKAPVLNIKLLVNIVQTAE